MDVVLANIQYNTECSKIIDDFEDFVKQTTPGCFWKTFDDIKKSADYIPEDLICAKLNTENMELAIEYLKKNPECYLNDFHTIKKLLEVAESEEEAEEEVDEWLDELPCHLYIFYHTAIDILWKENWQR